jgi:hypothetical protein
VQDTVLGRDLHNLVASPRAYAGYSVHDPRGRRLGDVKEVYFNDAREPEYVEVGVGLFGRRAVLIPVLSVAVDEERRVLTLQ